MSKRKGVSAEEKKTRMLQLFYEKKTFFQLKELEKIAPKEKGIIANSVKDVIQTLVDDGLVDTDKIGTSIYFWAFPSKTENAKKRKLAELHTELETFTKKLASSENELEAAKVGKEETAERRNELVKINDLRLERDELRSKLETFNKNDPKTIHEDLENVKNAANRWTDNILTLKSWCNRKFFIEGPTFDKQFGIPDNFDYIE